MQIKLATYEIQQIDKQVAAAQVRKAIAEKDLANHEKQIEQAKKVEEFLHTKYTSQELYNWMVSQVSALYFQTYQLAYDLAKQAERCYCLERGITKSGFIEFGIWDSLRKGLLAGEPLSLQLRQLERAYLEQNRREYELTKNVSLLMHAPLALIQLKETGTCLIDLPETLFDVDYPGHFMRPIKSVSISIPAVAGPYTSVNCTLTLLYNKTRIKSELRGGKQYTENLEAEDDRFVTNFASMQSIATSTGQNDNGMFELNFRDERYLPFEGAGVVSRWRIELPDEFRQFDYDTISDVVLHLRYTAREGGRLLRNGAITYVKEQIAEAQAAGSVRLFSVRHEFPTEWAKFHGQTPGADERFELALNLRKEHYPFWSHDRLNSVTRVDILARSTTAPVPGSMDIADKADKNDDTAEKDSLDKDAALGDLLVGKLTNIALPAPVGAMELFFDDNALSDLWIAVTWSA